MMCSKCARRMRPAKKGAYHCEGCGGAFLELGAIKDGIPALIFRGLPSKPSEFSCPADDARMLAARVAGVELEHCPACQGVWFDRQELERVKKQIQPDFNMPKEALRDVDWKKLHNPEENWLDFLLDAAD
jgi:Zn-finger nucleic acid-binding protein